MNRRYFYGEDLGKHSFHLFLDKPMTWPVYRNLLKALADAGIIEEGYANASIERGGTFVATKPWKNKVAA